MEQVSPFEVVAASQSPPSSEIEDEECKVGMEDKDGIPVMPPVNPETGTETEGAVA